MTNISRSTMELLLVTLVLTASMALVVDAPLNLDRDLVLPSGRSLTTPGADAWPSTSEAHRGRPYFQRRHLERLEVSLSRKSWQIEMRRTHAAAARYQVLRAEAACRPVEIRLADALEKRGQPLDTLAARNARDTALEALKLDVVAATRRLHRTQQVLNQVERSIARRTLRVLRLETQRDLTQQGVTPLTGRRAGYPPSAPAPRPPA